MSEIKWIKIAVDIFDNRKIKQIERMPEGDSIIIIWFKLICLAGSVNDDGMVYLTKDIPYDAEMLAQQFGRSEEMVIRAIKVFEKFGMISNVSNVTDNVTGNITKNVMQLSNWGKYQNIEGMDRIKEQNRMRQQRYRSKSKDDVNANMDKTEKGNVNSNVTHNVTVTLSNGTESESDQDIDIDIDIDKESISHSILLCLSDKDIDRLNEIYTDVPGLIKAINTKLKDRDNPEPIRKPYAYAKKCAEEMQWGTKAAEAERNRVLAEAEMRDREAEDEINRRVKEWLGRN